MGRKRWSVWKYEPKDTEDYPLTCLHLAAQVKVLTSRSPPPRHHQVPYSHDSKGIIRRDSLSQCCQNCLHTHGDLQEAAADATLPHTPLSVPQMTQNTLNSHSQTRHRFTLITLKVHAATYWDFLGYLCDSATVSAPPMGNRHMGTRTIPLCGLW